MNEFLIKLSYETLDNIFVDQGVFFIDLIAYLQSTLNNME
jgi:hypothetical protein